MQKKVEFSSIVSVPVLNGHGSFHPLLPDNSPMPAERDLPPSTSQQARVQPPVAMETQQAPAPMPRERTHAGQKQTNVKVGRYPIL